MVMDAPRKADVTVGLTEADIATCTSPFDVSKFVELDADSGSSSAQGTVCTRVAEADGAYPIQPEFVQRSLGGKEPRWV